MVHIVRIVTASDLISPFSLPLSRPGLHSWVNPSSPSLIESESFTMLLYKAAYLDKTKDTLFDTQYCSSSGDCCQKVLKISTLLFCNNSPPFLLLLSNKDENKGHVLGTQKTEITSRQEMKGKQLMYVLEVFCVPLQPHSQFGLV